MADSLIEYIINQLFSISGEWLVIIGALVSTLIVGSFIMGLQIIGPYIERKGMARMQGRRGPTYVGFRGILQIPADLIKLLFKEDMLPSKADSLGFFASIALISITSIISFVPLPIANGIIGAELASGLLFIFAVFSIFPPAMFIAGWSSNSKYALIGGFRSAGQLLAYEIPMFVSALSIIAINSSFSLTEITNSQNLSFPGWNVFNWYGLGLILALIFFIAGMAETERTPFDIPEAEAELVMGPRTEFSGWRYGLILMVEYLHLTINSLLLIYLFFGGYDLIPFVQLGDFENFFLVQIAAITIKLMLAFFIAAWIRAAFPRMRIDQLLTLGWKQMLPVAAIASIGIIGTNNPRILGFENNEIWGYVINFSALILIFIFMFLTFLSNKSKPSNVKTKYNVSR